MNQTKLIGLLLVAVFFPCISLFSQVDYFDIDGELSGNDANGNAVIKWRITICAGSTPATGVTVRVPSVERDATQSGGTGIADETL